MVFLNDRDKNVRIKEYFKDWNFELIDSRNKNRTYKRLINESILVNNVVVTSLVNDGVNILNKSWDYVFIIDNMTQTPSDVYQLTSRFRKSNPKIWYLYIPWAKKDIPIIDINERNLAEYLNNQFEAVKKHRWKICKEANKEVSNCDITILDIPFIYQDYAGKNYVNEYQVMEYVYSYIKDVIRFQDINFKTFLKVYFNLNIHNFAPKIESRTKSDKDTILEFFIENLPFVINYLSYSDIKLGDVSEEENEKITFIIINKRSLERLLEKYYELNQIEADYIRNDVEFDYGIFELLAIEKSYAYRNKIETIRNYLVRESDSNFLSSLDKTGKKDLETIFNIFKSIRDKKGKAKVDDFIYAYDKLNKDGFTIEIDNDSTTTMLNRSIRRLGFEIKRIRNVNYIYIK